MNDCGDILSSAKANLVWKVDNFLQSSVEKKSPYFTFRGVKCRMILDLSISKNTNEDSFTIYLTTNEVYYGELHDIVIRSFIKDKFGREYFSFIKYYEHSILELPECIWSVSRNSLLANYEVLIEQPNKTLIFCCEIKPILEDIFIEGEPNLVMVKKKLSNVCGKSMSMSEVETNKPNNKDGQLKETETEIFCAEGASSATKTSGHFERLSRDLGNLLATGKGADVTLKCAYRKFRVHRTILSARCKIFAERYLKQNQEEIVEVTDTDSLFLAKFLECIYTGNVMNLTVNIAEELYILGNKYEFEPLILICAKFLVKELNDENLCRFFRLASDYEDNKSLKDIIHFILDKENFLMDKYWFKRTFHSDDLILEVYKAIEDYGNYY